MAEPYPKEKAPEGFYHAWYAQMPEGLDPLETMRYATICGREPALYCTKFGKLIAVHEVTTEPKPCIQWPHMDYLGLVYKRCERPATPFFDEPDCEPEDLDWEDEEDWQEEEDEWPYEEEDAAIPG